MIPEHCVRPGCTHFKEPSTQKWYKRNGFHKTITFGKVPRYQCKSCGKTFSDQTFSIDYYVKKKVDYQEIRNQVISASGNRDMARKMLVSDATIQNRIDRLSRWSQGIHQLLLQELSFTEDLAADGFESFSASQYYPNNINIIGGMDSQFLYSTGFSILKRKGRMTDQQKAVKAEIEKKNKYPKGDTARSMKALALEIANLLQDKGIREKVIWSDLHRAYPAAFCLAERFSVAFHHRRISSKESRTRQNPLFAVNYLDRQFRKDLSDHARESVQFARHPSCMMNRLLVYRHHHNCLKPFRIKEHKEASGKPITTHGEKAGISREKLTSILQENEGQRFFLHKMQLNDEERNSWFMNWQNPGMDSKRYRPKHLAV